MMKLREALILQSPSLALQRAAADEIARQDALIVELLWEVSSIEVYLGDTLSGRTDPDPTTYKQWLVDGVAEAHRRANSAAAKAKKFLHTT